METEKNEKLIHSLLDINHMMHRLYEGKASQSRILIILYEQQCMTQKELTELLGIQPGSASEILAKLEKAGLLKRVPSEKDHRTMELFLTPEGEKMAEEALANRQERHRQMFDCLSEEEGEQLSSLLEKLKEDWKLRFSLESDCEHRKGKKKPGKKEER